MKFTISLWCVAGVCAGLSVMGITSAQDPETEGVCCMAPSANATRTPVGPQGETRGAGPVVLDFEGLGNLEPVEEFYNNGQGGDGSGPGPNFGITFSDNALGIIDADAGGTGNFGGEPSPDTVLFFLTGTAATMNVPGGFTSGFSFFYSAINNPGQIVVYDGPDGTGNVLATLDLPLTPENGAPDPTGNFSPLVPTGVSFSGTAQSVDFGGTIDQIAFDNITLGSENPGGGGQPPDPVNVPIFTAGGLVLLAGLLAMLALLRLRG